MSFFYKIIAMGKAKQEICLFQIDISGFSVTIQNLHKIICNKNSFATRAKVIDMLEQEVIAKDTYENNFCLALALTLDGWPQESLQYYNKAKSLKSEEQVELEGSAVLELAEGHYEYLEKILSNIPEKNFNSEILNYLTDVQKIRKPIREEYIRNNACLYKITDFPSPSAFQEFSYLKRTTSLSKPRSLDHEIMKIYETHLTKLQPFWSKQKPTCSISYAWPAEGDDRSVKESQKLWIDMFAEHLKYAGFDVTYDIWNNLHSGNIARFVSKVVNQEYVFLIGTPLLWVKATQEFRVVSREVKGIIERVKENDEFLYLVVKEGEHSVSIPKELSGFSSTDFRRPEQYPLQLMSMLCKCIRIAHDNHKFVAIQDALMTALKEHQEVKEHVMVNPTFRKELTYNCYDINLPSEGDWIRRRGDEEALATQLKQPSSHIIEITHLGGSGKSSFVRQFLNQLAVHDLAYEGTFWFSFYHLRSGDIRAPFNTFLNFMLDQLKVPYEEDDIPKKRKLVQKYIGKYNFLIVLDGFEVVQHYNEDEKKSNSRYGELRDKEFNYFLTDLMQLSTSKVIITTRANVADFSPRLCRGYHRFDLHNWTEDDVIGYFQTDDIKGSVSDIQNIIGVLGNHPLTLSVFKGILLELYEGDLSKTRKILDDIRDEVQEESTAVSLDYEKQLKKLKEIIRFTLSSLDDDQQYFMNNLSLLYGEIAEENLDVLLKPKPPHNSVRHQERAILKYISLFKKRNLIIEGRMLETGNVSGKRTISAHPMVKFGFYELMEEEARMQAHRYLMSYFQNKAIQIKEKEPEAYSNHMEWAHQLTRIVMHAELLSHFQYELNRMNMITFSKRYQALQSLMTNLLTKRSTDYLGLHAERFKKSRSPSSDTESIPTQEVNIDVDQKDDSLGFVKAHLKGIYKEKDRIQLVKAMGTDREVLQLSCACLSQEEMPLDTFFRDVDMKQRLLCHSFDERPEQVSKLAVVMCLCLTSLQKRHQNAFEFIRLCSYLNGNHIPPFLLELFVVLKKTETWSLKKGIEEIKTILAEYKIMELVEERYTMKERYQTIIRKVIGKGDAEGIIRKAEILLASGFQEDFSRLKNWQRNLELCYQMTELENEGEKLRISVSKVVEQPLQQIVFYCLYLETLLKTEKEHVEEVEKDRKVFPSQENAFRRLNTVYEKVIYDFEEKLAEIGKSIYAKRYKVPIPNCFISYAWGRIEHENFVREKLDRHLQFLLTGENVTLDERNNRTDDISRFTALAAEQDRVILVATRATLEKYNRGMITERIFKDIVLKETYARALIVDLKKYKIIKSGHFNWSLDFEKNIREAIDSIFKNPIMPEALRTQKENILNKLLAVCREQREIDLPVLQQEISIIQNSCLNDATKQGTTLLVLLESVPKKTIPILLRGLPVIFFNQGMFTKTDLSFLYPDQKELEYQWQILTEKVYIDSDGNYGRPTRRLTEKLRNEKAELIREIGPVLVEFLITVDERYYAWNFLRMAENLNIPGFGREAIEVIKESMQGVVSKEVRKQLYGTEAHAEAQLQRLQKEKEFKADEIVRLEGELAVEIKRIEEQIQEITALNFGMPFLAWHKRYNYHSINQINRDIADGKRYQAAGNSAAASNSYNRALSGLKRLLTLDVNEMIKNRVSLLQMNSLRGLHTPRRELPAIPATQFEARRPAIDAQIRALIAHFNLEIRLTLF